jgi:3-deoxy-D-manno-octulosonic-acid transferase
MIVEIYKNVLNTEENVNLQIGPRHIQRIPNIEKVIISYGFVPVRITKLTKPIPKKAIFLLDTIGELLYFYSLCDFCFVGGSLIKFGGHNILEPIYFGKPTCFGLFMDNFKDIEEVVLDKGAAIRIRNKEELQKVILTLVKDSALRKNLEMRCKEVFEEERKSLKMNLEIILKCIKM